MTCIDVNAELIIVNERLANALLSEAKILKSQEYTIKDRTKIMPQLNAVRELIRDLQTEKLRLCQGGVKAVLAYPRTL